MLLGMLILNHLHGLKVYTSGWVLLSGNYITSTKKDIPEKAHKEIEYQFQYEIVSKVE